MAFLGAAMLAGWVVLAFARQVGDASAATTRLADLAAANEQLAGQVAALDREYQLIQRQEWISQQARAHGLGSDREIPFALAPGAPALGSNAPGSAAVRLGATDGVVTPLESWLTLLFGPSR